MFTFARNFSVASFRIHYTLWSPKFRPAYNFTVIAHKSTGNGDESIDTKIAKLSQDIAHLKNVTKENMTRLEDLVKQKMDSGHEMMSKDIKYASDILQNKLTRMHTELKQEIQNVRSIMQTKERVWKDVRNLTVALAVILSAVGTIWGTYQYRKMS